jgi:tRNA A37 N6-isopentenylltransferase MiaA
MFQFLDCIQNKHICYSYYFQLKEQEEVLGDEVNLSVQQLDWIKMINKDGIMVGGTCLYLKELQF